MAKANVMVFRDKAQFKNDEAAQIWRATVEKNLARSLPPEVTATVSVRADRDWGRLDVFIEGTTPAEKLGPAFLMALRNLADLADERGLEEVESQQQLKKE